MMCRRVERLGASLLLANLSPTALHCQSLFTHCHKTEFSVVHFPRSALDTLIFKSTVYQTMYCTLYTHSNIYCSIFPTHTPVLSASYINCPGCRFSGLSRSEFKDRASFCKFSGQKRRSRCFPNQNYFKSQQKFNS